MKKFNFLKTVLSVAFATILTMGAFAQPYPPVNYERYDSDKLNPDTIDYVTLKTGGTTMGYYAMPDPVYHPNYVTTGAITNLFWWNWTNNSAVGNQATFAKPGVANYVEINYQALGNYAIRVAEHAPTAFGGCGSADSTLLNVTVINPPVATISTADTTAEACGSLPPTPVAIQFTENIPWNWAAYAFAVVEEIVNLDAAGNPIVASRVTDSTHVSFPTNAKLHFPNTASSPYSYTFNTSARSIVNSARTRYTYTLIKASDLPRTASQGLVSGISQKSDYLNAPASITKYAFGAHPSISWIVNPAPVTGPIYHIPNDFAY